MASSEATVAQRAAPPSEPTKKMVLAAKRDRADRSFDLVVVELDASLIEEPAEGAPTGECIADRLGQAAAGRNAAELRLKPDLHGIDQRRGGFAFPRGATTPAEGHYLHGTAK